MRDNAGLKIEVRLKRVFYYPDEEGWTPEDIRNNIEEELYDMGISLDDVDIMEIHDA